MRRSTRLFQSAVSRTERLHGTRVKSIFYEYTLGIEAEPRLRFFNLSSNLIHIKIK